MIEGSCINIEELFLSLPVIFSPELGLYVSNNSSKVYHYSWLIYKAPCCFLYYLLRRYLK